MRFRSHWRTVTLAAAGIAVGTALGPALATAGVESVKDVFVTNDAEGEAIATKAVGTTAVRIDGTPGFQVVGTPKVALADGSKVGLEDGSKVEVTNSPGTALSVRPVETKSTHVARHLHFELEGDTAHDSYTVPAGKRLTVEQVTISDRGMPERLERAVVAAMSNPRSIFDHIQYDLVAHGMAGDFETVSQTGLDIVADPGTTVFFRIHVNRRPTDRRIAEGSFVGTLSDAAP